MTARPEDPHLWPESTVAALLAGLTATTNADAATALKRGLAKGDAA